MQKKSKKHFINNENIIVLFLIFDNIFFLLIYLEILL